MVKVVSRKRKLKNSTALYLDYRINGKRYQEPTGLHIYPGNDEQTKQANKDNKIRFELLRNEKEKQLLNGIVALPINRQKIDFIEFYRDYLIKFPSRERRARSVLNKLLDFNKSNVLPLSVINEDYLLAFKTYLEGHLTGETPHNYFKYLAKVLKYATKLGLFSANPAGDIIVKKMAGIQKQTLTTDEIAVLYKSYCSNDGVKRAFLFCCFTGLRYCDVSQLKWENINGKQLTVKQAKTGFNVSVDIHTDAFTLLGQRNGSKDKVFTLPTTLDGCNKVLKAWVRKHGIDKKITWHCGRHSLATNLVLNNVDILSVSSVLGHRSLTHTQRYITIADSMRKNAIDKLPMI